MSCRACPRNCNVSRTAATSGFCGVSNEIKVARAALHFWEEPCISGEEGSGTVFFSGCNLQCVYCQNKEIAQGRKGKYISQERLGELFLELQDQGANNINLVTPSHYYLQIGEALETIREKLRVPVISNTSSYDSVETLKKIEGKINIFLADYKYESSMLAKKYSLAEDYPVVAKRALQEMYRQVGEPVFDKRGMLQRGMVIRHLLLPGYLKESKEAICYLYETFGNSVYLSIMNQYTPLSHVVKYPEINRKVTEDEYEELVDYALELGVENAYIQEGETAEESFIPQF